MRFPFALWKPAAGGGSPPTLASVSPTLGDTLGGELLTIIGTNFTGASAVTIGGTAATGFSVISATEIIAIAPAHAAGAGQNILVTAPGGTNTANMLYEFWSPAVMPLTGFWERGDYDAQTATWTARSSAGLSGGRNLTQVAAANVPTETNLEPICEVSRYLTSAITSASFLTGAAYSVVAVFQANAATAPGVSNDVTTTIVGDSTGSWGLAFSTAGVRAWHYAAGQLGPLVATPLGLHVAVARYDGINIYLSVDGGVETAVAVGALAGLGGTLRVGTNSAAALGFSGPLRAIALLDSTLSTTNRDKIVQWARARHGVAA
jgi:hypothetical protein